MISEKNTEIKSIEGWGKYADEHRGENTDWDSYCKPGDLVSEDVYDYFLDILPPRTMSGVMLQVGEPHSTALNPKTGKWQNTYATFVTVKGDSKERVYRYCGNCFAGQTLDTNFYRDYGTIREFLKATYSTRDGLQDTRPRIVCKDGFEFSVQAGYSLYSAPRENLESGDYTACEVGFPNRKDDLLMEYIESTREKPTKSVYPYVPVEVIDQIISNHGGYFISTVPFV
jgi:hypothetical protein